MSHDPTPQAPATTAGASGLPTFDGMGRVDDRKPRPYVMVDRELVELLPPDELALYVVLLSFLRTPKATTSRECWPSHEAIAEAYGRSVDAVQRVMRKLVKRGLVTVKRRGKTQSNLYRLASSLPGKAIPSDAAISRLHPGDAADMRSHPSSDTAEVRLPDTADLRSRDAAEVRHEVEVVEVAVEKETLPPQVPQQTAPAAFPKDEEVDPLALELAQRPEFADMRPTPRELAEILASARAQTQFPIHNIPRWAESANGIRDIRSRLYGQRQRHAAATAPRARLVVNDTYDPARECPECGRQIPAGGQALCRDCREDAEQAEVTP